MATQRIIWPPRRLYGQGGDPMVKEKILWPVGKFCGQGGDPMGKEEILWERRISYGQGRDSRANKSNTAVLILSSSSVCFSFFIFTLCHLVANPIIKANMYGSFPLQSVYGARKWRYQHNYLQNMKSQRYWTGPHAIKCKPPLQCATVNNDKLEIRKTSSISLRKKVKGVKAFFNSIQRKLG